MLVFTLFLLPLQAGQGAENGNVVRALQAMHKDQWTLARKLITDSQDDVGAKLYLWMFYREAEGDIEFAKLSRFIKDNPAWPGMKDLREKAEKNMPRDLGAQNALSWFALYPPQTARGLDIYTDALLISGKNAEAKKIVGDWWVSKLATRDEQKTIYSKYGALIDMKAHRRRLDTLLFSKQYTNARAVAGVIGKGYPELTEARIALAEEKPGVKKLIDQAPAALQSDPGLLYERLRWRRRNDMDMDAMKIIHNHPPVDQIQNPEDWWKEQHIVIRRLMEKHAYESAYLLATEHFQKEGVAYADAEWLTGWLALRFMKKPSEAYKRFENLYEHVETPISRSRAAYWAARAADGMNKPELAKEWYQKSATHQTVFYGQLAGAKLGMAEALPHAAPPVLTAADSAEMNNADLIRSARLLHDAGMHDDATNFLEAFVDSRKSPKAYRFTAELAAKLGYYRDAVKIAKDATKDGMFLTAQSYPAVTDMLRHVDTEWALVHAVIRQESMFDPAALSPTGALGLMQLMPGTAKQVSKKHGMAYSQQALTSNPSQNIRLGSAYMNELLERFDGSYPLAIAAYNAGPSNVRKWINTFGDPRTGAVDPIDWIEQIPFPETRNYVQRVLESVYVYRLRLKGVQKPPVHAIHIAMAQQQ